MDGFHAEENAIDNDRSENVLYMRGMLRIKSQFRWRFFTHLLQEKTSDRSASVLSNMKSCRDKEKHCCHRITDVLCSDGEGEETADSTHSSNSHKYGQSQKHLKKAMTFDYYHCTLFLSPWYFICVFGFFLHSAAQIQNRHINAENLAGNKTKKKQNKQIIQPKIQMQTMHKKCFKILDTDNTCTQHNEWWRTELLQWNIASISHERVSLVTRAANLFRFFTDGMDK